MYRYASATAAEAKADAETGDTDRNHRKAEVEKLRSVAAYSAEEARSSAHLPRLGPPGSESPRCAVTHSATSGGVVGRLCRPTSGVGCAGEIASGAR